MKRLNIVLAIALLFCSVSVVAPRASFAAETPKVAPYDRMTTINDIAGNSYLISTHIEPKISIEPDEYKMSKVTFDYSESWISFTNMSPTGGDIPALYVRGIVPLYDAHKKYDPMEKIGASGSPLYSVRGYYCIYDKHYLFSEVNARMKGDMYIDCGNYLELNNIKHNREVPMRGLFTGDYYNGDGDICVFSGPSAYTYFLGTSSKSPLPTEDRSTASIVVDSKFANQVVEDIVGYGITFMTNAEKDLGHEDWIDAKTEVFGHGDYGYYLLDPIMDGKIYDFDHKKPGKNKKNYIFSYQPKFDCGPVDLKINGNIDTLLTVQDWFSMQTYCSVFAADENLKTVEYLKSLGLQDVVEKKTRDTTGIWPDDETFFIGHKKMSDGRELVFVYARGTDGDAQIISDFNFASSTRDTGGEHDGFSQGRAGMEKIISEYLKYHDIDPNNTFFCLDGYSRGAGIIDLLAAGSIADVEMNADNCLAYTFCTPNTISENPGEPKPWIIDVIDASDPVAGLPPGWFKHGTTLGYTHNEKAQEKFYGTTKLRKDASLIDGIGNKMLNSHVAENIIARVFEGEPVLQWDSESHRYTGTHCPTNTYVIKDNVAVASVVDNKIYSDGSVFITTDAEGKKNIVAPDDDSYRIVAEATDNGTMIVSTFVFSDRSSDVVEPQEFGLDKGDAYEINMQTGEPVLLEDFIAPETKTRGSLPLAAIIPTVILGAIMIPIIIILVVNGERKRRRTK